MLKKVILLILSYLIIIDNIEELDNMEIQRTQIKNKAIEVFKAFKPLLNI